MAQVTFALTIRKLTRGKVTRKLGRELNHYPNIISRTFMTATRQESEFTVAAYIARFLRQQGIQRFWGITGGENVDLINACYAEQIDFQLVHHENTAAFLAQNTAFLTGVPSVFLTTLGPGATNIINAVADAYLARLPLIVITADFEDPTVEFATHQNAPLLELLRPITKWNVRLTPANTADSLAYAWAVAAQGRPGPVHLALPAAVARQTIAAVPLQASARPTGIMDAAPLPHTAHARLTTCDAPVVVLGLEANHRLSQEAIVALVDQWGAPVVNMPMSKGIFPEDHPLFAGIHSVYGYAIVDEFLAQADCILAVGLDGSDFIHPWQTEATTIAIHPHTEVDSAFGADYVLVGDLDATVRRLTPELTHQGDWGPRAAAACRAKIQQRLAPKDTGEATASLTKAAVAPQAVLATLRDLTPPETIFACDVGSHKLLSCQMWQSTQPQTFLVSNGLSTMGFGVPAALAAKLCDPERPVVCVTGDGGLLMYAGELETVKRLAPPSNAPFVIVVFVDSTLALIRTKSEERGYAGIENDFGHTDYVKLAAAFDLPAIHIQSEDECAAKLQEALALNRPVLVAVEIDVDEYRHMGG
ncbi:MAG: thiamine pyrophosphate-binding protein [Chloroflexi bacterium]|nr:thiamine pyrophosphate-binding protein [Chloroflexota bacterium]